MKFTIVKDYVFGIGFPVGIVDKETGDLFSEIDRTSTTKFRSQQYRRSHVQLFIFNLLLVAGFGLIGSSDLANNLFIWLSFALLITSSIVRYSILGMADLPANKLDERERLLRGETLVKSYNYLGFATIFLMLATVLWGGAVTPHHVVVATILFIATSITLPSAIIAWKEEEI